MSFFIRYLGVICLILRSIILQAQDPEHSGKVDLFTGPVPVLTIKPRPLVWSDAPVSLSFAPLPPEVMPSLTRVFPFEENREPDSPPEETDLFSNNGTGINDLRQRMKGREINTPWMAISSIPFAAGGVAAHFRAKALHRDYVQSIQTDEAVRLRKEVKQMQFIRNASFGAAGLLGVTGVLFNKKKHRTYKRVRMEYLPFACGGSIGITF